MLSTSAPCTPTGSPTTHRRVSPTTTSKQMPREPYRTPTAKIHPTHTRWGHLHAPHTSFLTHPPVNPGRVSSANQTIPAAAYLKSLSIPVFHHCPLSSTCLVDPKHVEHVTDVSPPQLGHGISLPSGPVEVRPMQNVHCVRPLPLQYVQVSALASAAAARSETGRRSQPGMEPAPLWPTTERKLLAQVALETGLGALLRRSRAAARDAAEGRAGCCFGTVVAGASVLESGAAAIRGGTLRATGRNVQAAAAARRPVAHATVGEAPTKVRESILIGAQGMMNKEARQQSSRRRRRVVQFA